MTPWHCNSLLVQALVSVQSVDFLDVVGIPAQASLTNTGKDTWWNAVFCKLFFFFLVKEINDSNEL